MKGSAKRNSEGYQQLSYLSQKILWPKIPKRRENYSSGSLIYIWHVQFHAHKWGIYSYVTYAPSGRVIYYGNIPNTGRDISSLCRIEPVIMVRDAKFPVFRQLVTSLASQTLSGRRESGNTPIVKLCRHCMVSVVDKWVMLLCNAKQCARTKKALA